MTHKLRASYTYLSLWASGRWQEAIAAYFRLSRYTSREMAEGIEYHNEWSQHIINTNTLPEVFGGKKMSTPICEEKNVIPLYDWLDLVIKIDCYDDPIIYEFKTGVTDSSEYAASMQPAVYAVGVALQKKSVKYVDIYQFNQYEKKSSYSRVVVTPSLISNGADFVERVGREMHEYFLKNNLYEMYSRTQNK